MDWKQEVLLLSKGNKNYINLYGWEVLEKIRDLRIEKCKCYNEIAFNHMNMKVDIVANICRKYKWIPKRLGNVENATAWNKGLKNKNNRKSIFEIKSSQRIKQRLIADGIKLPICEECGWDYKNHPKWEFIENKENCPLEIHHEDGNKENNVLENLKLLCPNCHSLTQNYRFRKRTANG